tara:strand:- start:4592 stop:5497 length:906 start_codon:yes stop_codon:yes gene_type:complete
MANDLLKEAIADAKAVRETALANAKIALEEAFTPRLQSMLSAKLAEEEGLDEPELEAEPVAEEPPVEEPVAAEGRGIMDADEDPMDVHSEEMAPEDEPVAEDEDLELEAIIKELESEIHEEEEPASEEPVAENAEGEDDAPVAEEGRGDEVDEDISIDEIINALREEDEADETPVEEAKEDEGESKKDLEEAYNVIRFLKGKINEVNLLNAKLLFSNKLFKNHSMNESQKMKVIENFDRASSIREVKLVYATLSESFNLNGKTKRSIKESYASTPSRSTAPKKVISEGTALSARWKKLANL